MMNDKISGYGYKKVIGDEIGFTPTPRETLKTQERGLSPEPTPDYPNATQRLDELFKVIEILEMETTALFVQIDTVLSDVNETQNEPMPGPRASNSNLTYRIAHAADLIEELTNRINLVRRRITL